MAQAGGQIKLGEVTLPKGGGAYAGLGERFSLDYFSGEAGFSFPVPATPVRGYSPNLVLHYQAAGGNGVFGMGFLLNVPFIGRLTTRRIPRYDESDVFYSGVWGELTETKEGFRPILGSEAVKIERKGQSWKLTDEAGGVQYYGESDEALIREPEGAVFCFLLSREVDACGNEAVYCYEKDGNNAYLSRILYGNMEGEQKKGQYCCALRFHYEKGRADAFESFKGGFGLLTDRLCTCIEQSHMLYDEMPVKRVCFRYESGPVSLLKEICCEARVSAQEPWQSLPAIRFTYEPFHFNKGSFFPMEIENASFPQGGISGLQFFDLYGEGVPGLFYSDGVTNLYYPPRGGGKYGRPEALEGFPVQSGLEEPGVLLTSLCGNGKQELVGRQGTMTGYYALERGEWQPFRPFATWPAGSLTENDEWVDLEGNAGCSLFQVLSEEGRYYPSKGRQGLGNPVERMLPEGFPKTEKKGKESFTGFADVLGDGLRHRVRITNGLVEYWPNLGYGRFGERRVIPGFTPGSDFDARRIFLADVDGSGIKSLIYAQRNRLVVFQNQGGRRFLAPAFLSLPFSFTDHSRLFFADVDGSGCESAVMMGPGEEGCFFLRLCEGRKPYLLSGIESGSRSIRIEYESSAVQYFKDKREGISWQSVPPFPIHVVAKVTETDWVSQITSTKSYRYRHGYYDADERQFMGFGFVEEVFREQGKEAPFASMGSRHCRWFYTGRVDEDYRGEFFSTPEEDSLPLPVFMAGEEGRAQARALKASLARMEVWRYADREDAPTCPITCTENTYQVVRSVLNQTGRKDCYRTLLKESFTKAYEECKEDARTERFYGLAYDDNGRPLTTLTVYEARKRPQEEGQKKARGVLHQFSYAGRGDLPSAALSEQQKYEVEEIPQIRGDAFWEECAKKLIFQEKYYYWDEALREELPLGSIASHGLLHHTMTAVFPHKVQQEIPDFTQERLWEAGYRKEPDGWFLPGRVTYYSGQRLYLPVAEDFPYLGKTHNLCRRIELFYDAYGVFPVRQCRQSAETTLTEEYFPDYRAMSYTGMRDWNQNVTGVVLDAFGRVAATARWDGQRENPLKNFKEEPGTMQEILADKAGFLQGADERFLYLYGEKKEEPNTCIVLSNLLPDGELADKDEEIGCTVCYTDAGGNVVSQKMQSGAVYLEKARTIYGSGGKVIGKGRPRMAEGAAYEPCSSDRFVEWNQYDALDRRIRVVRPFLRMAGQEQAYVEAGTRYEPWRISKYDENDLSHTYDWYQAIKDKETKTNPRPLQEQDMLDGFLKGEAHANTPVTVELDVMGKEIAERRSIDTQRRVTRYFQIDGQVERVVSKTGRIAYRFRRGLDGHVFCTETAEAGRTITLQNVYGEPVFEKDSTGKSRVVVYDGLGRRAQHWEEDVLVMHILYGEEAPEASERNLLGSVWKVQGQDGERTIGRRDVRGNVLCREIRLCQDMEDITDWKSEVILSEERYEENCQYNRQGLLLAKTDHEHSETRYRYDMCGRLAQEESGELRCEFTYNEAGLEKRSVYGNGVIREACYDPATLWLTGVRATDADGRILQDQQYFYDFHGNMTRVRNRMAERSYQKNQSVDGVCDYTYDEEYRLIKASGRELNGPANDLACMETYRETYYYDGDGNLVKKVHKSPSAQWTKNFTVDEASCRLIGENDEKALYDERGRPVQLPGICALTWNGQGQLIKAVLLDRGGEDDIERYRYDGNGNRVRRVSVRQSMAGDERTEVISFGSFRRKRKWIGEQLVLDRTERQLFGPSGRPCAVAYQWKRGEKHGIRDARRYLLCDHRHSVCVETDEEGMVTAAEEYYPYGGSAVSFADSVKRAARIHRYCGWERDGATGLYCYGARYYSASWGRFLTPDDMAYVDLADAGTLNRYAYCLSNPITLFDPDGHDITIIYDDTDPQISQEVHNFQGTAPGTNLSGETIHYVPVRSKRQFLRAWNGVGTAGNGRHTVVIYTHGHHVIPPAPAPANTPNPGNPTEGYPMITNTITPPGGRQGVDIQNVTNNPNISEALFLCCFAGVEAQRGNGTTSSAATQTASKIAPGGTVAGADGEVLRRNSGGGITYTTGAPYKFQMYASVGGRTQSRGELQMPVNGESLDRLILTFRGQADAARPRPWWQKVAAFFGSFCA